MEKSVVGSGDVAEPLKRGADGEQCEEEEGRHSGHKNVAVVADRGLSPESVSIRKLSVDGFLVKFTQLGSNFHHVCCRDKSLQRIENQAKEIQDRDRRYNASRLTTSQRWTNSNRMNFLKALSDAGGETTAQLYCLVAACSLYLFASFYLMVLSKLLPRTGIFILDAIRDDWYYSIWLPFLFPTTILFVYWNWLSMKFFKHS
eukprot:GHVS01021543.1.p1 GENE.GHVS01021543.1~~GHVS01021543.1.p1  ORF type:complete len:202 (-),score=18.81 GHVS01021543.1:106-711(-)